MYNKNRIIAAVTNLENAGAAQSKICDALNKKGYTTATGKKWTLPNLGFFKSRYVNGAASTTTKKAVKRNPPRVAVNPLNPNTTNLVSPTLAFIGTVLKDGYLTADKKINVINAYIS